MQQRTRPALPVELAISHALVGVTKSMQYLGQTLQMVGTPTNGQADTESLGRMADELEAIAARHNLGGGNDNASPNLGASEGSEVPKEEDRENNDVSPVFSNEPETQPESEN